jgi:hypothetical protein
MMVPTIDGNTLNLAQPRSTRIKDIPLIEPKDIKAILYLGLRGEVSLPLEEHSVDIHA